MNGVFLRPLMTVGWANAHPTKQQISPTEKRFLMDFIGSII